MYWANEPKQRFYSVVELWDGDDPIEAICIRKPKGVPTTLCLETATDETLEFFDAVRSRMQENIKRGSKDFVRRKPGRRPVISGYADFSNVSFISTAAALILAAEYDRSKERLQRVPPTVNLHEWSTSAFSPLFEIGFFNTVGLSDDAGEKMYTVGNRKTMRIISMDENDNKLGQLDRYLEELYEFIRPGKSIPEGLRTNIITSVGEAVTNVRDHAYSDQNYEYRIPPIHRSWVTASADRDRCCLTVAVFDQGAGIPHTYPRTNLLPAVKLAVKDFLRKALSKVEGRPDAAYIEAAMLYGNSRTDLEHRGKGLPQMVNLIEIVGGGHMSVYSGFGWWRRGKSGVVTTGVSSVPVGGTLVDWTIDLGEHRDEV